MKMVCSRLSLWLLLLSIGCSVSYESYETSSGQRHYDITCMNRFERCESKAQDLCPDGFEKVSSSRQNAHIRGEPSSLTDDRYTLAIVCDPPATDAASGHPSTAATSVGNAP